MPVRTAEDELLLRCARTSDPPGAIGNIDSLLRPDIDWERFLGMAFSHGVAPLVYWQLDACCREDVPEHVLGQLRDHFHANRLRNLFLAGELLKLLGEFEARDIPAIPYKGPVLAASAYGNVALREFGDLDVLIHERDVLRAKEVMTHLGYSPQYRMTGAQEAASIRYDREYSFLREDGSAVELHWTPTPRPISFMLDTENLWKHTQLMRLGGGTVSTFLPEETILILCVHGSAHLWERLSWICDVAELVQASAGLDWERLLGRADVSNTKRMLLLGLFLANEVLGTELPQRIWHEIEADANVTRLAGGVLEHLFAEIPQGIYAASTHWRFHFRMMGSLQDRIRFCFHRATNPTPADWETVALPVALLPCYRLLRPIRLSGSAGRKLAKCF